jgi:hypothetical protein
MQCCICCLLAKSIGFNHSWLVAIYHHLTNLLAISCMKRNIGTIEQTALMKKHFWPMEWSKIFTSNQNMRNKRNVNQRTKHAKGKQFYRINMHSCFRKTRWFMLVALEIWPVELSYSIWVFFKPLNNRTFKVS